LSFPLLHLTFLLFSHAIHAMMRLGVRPVGGEIGDNGVDFTFNPVNLDLNTVKPDFKTVNFLTQHLVAFDDNIQLVLKILGHYPHIMLEHFFDLFEIISIHNISLRITTTKAFPSVQS
ncbi:MAG TPA: hypothetical protein VHN12_06245, partial [Geobacteraceae bacterium]|nr:hypothetical protein [Geobacteraceae bacterium]